MILFAQFAIISVEIDVRCKKFKVSVAKNTLVARYEDVKIMSPQKKSKTKANPYSATENRLKYNASLI